MKAITWNILGVGGTNCLKEGREFRMELNALMGVVKAHFVLIQEHHLNKMQLTRFAKMLQKEWLCYGSKPMVKMELKVGLPY